MGRNCRLQGTMIWYEEISWAGTRSKISSGQRFVAGCNGVRRSVVMIRGRVTSLVETLGQ